MNADLEHLLHQVAWHRTALQMFMRTRNGPPADGRELEALTRARAVLNAEMGAPGLRCYRLRALAGSEAAAQVLWVLAVVAIDSRARTLLGEPTADALRGFVFGDRPSLEALLVLGPAEVLRRLRLIERSDDGGAERHESRQTWGIAPRVLTWLHGDESVDPELAACASVTQGKEMQDVVVAEDARERARQALRTPGAVVVARGASGLGRRTLLAAVAREAGIAVLEIDARRVPTTAVAWKAIARECRLLERAPLVAHADEQLGLIGDALACELDTTILVTTAGKLPHWERPAIAVELRAPSTTERARVWASALPGADAHELARRYSLAPALVHAAGRAIRARAHGRQVDSTDVHAGVAAVVDDRFGELAHRIDLTQTWDDLVLAPDQLEAIVELCARIRRRSTVYEAWGFAAKVAKGLGVTALFSGPPGTGKTMVASLIARELELELVQVDTARVTSKYIGETEKHLDAVFDAAETAGAILLFDEADALFGKRTDVRSSHDRYANLETGYLLQRLERFTGICLLTSNHETHLDPAFQRRIAVHVRFELPDEHERAALWRAMLPRAAPIASQLDFAGLASRFALAGGHIRNAALRAAFLAAEEGSAISQAHLEHASRQEAEAMGKLAAMTL
jgi:ATP-dependent 26S proteasome regulatory subunit